MVMLYCLLIEKYSGNGRDRERRCRYQKRHNFFVVSLIIEGFLYFGTWIIERQFHCGEEEDQDKTCCSSLWMSVNINCSFLLSYVYIDSRLELCPYKMYCDIFSYPFFFCKDFGTFLVPVCRGFRMREFICLRPDDCERARKWSPDVRWCACPVPEEA